MASTPKIDKMVEYNRKHYTTISAKLRRDLVEEFLQAVAEDGTTSYAVIKSCLEDYLRSRKSNT